jgi:hypothetical protein
LDVYGNLAFSLKLAKRNKAEIDQWIKRVAEMLKIDQLLQRRVGQLSGGQPRPARPPHCTSSPPRPATGSTTRRRADRAALE